MPNTMNFTDEEARNYISLIFDGYRKRKKEKRLYNHDGIPELIIKTYYSCVEKPSYDQLMNNFKRRYTYNENKVEDIRSKEEKDGLKLGFDYVLNKEDLQGISIYDLSWIHEELYKKTAHPEFGGKYRNEERYLYGKDENGNIITANVELTPYWEITHEMNLLRSEVSEIVEIGLKLRENINVDEIIKYINRCVELNCKLIKIHPFGDGNGRAVRIFTNLLFRIANIPPVYVENKEKIKYREAMNNALVNEDHTDIYDFYHYKICDSIIALDVGYNNMKHKQYSDSKASKSKGNR